MVDTYGVRLASLEPETGKRPGSRIGSASNARSLVGRLKYEDETRMYRATKISGLMDGNPPWSAQRLSDLGQAHRANFNLRESEGIVEAAKTPYYDLVFEVPYFARIEFGLEGADPTLLSNWNDIISEEYSDTLLTWDGFDQNIQLHQWQMVVNGVGPIFWPHYIGWHAEAVKSRKVLVPMETKANVEELELVVILHSYRADELDQFIQKGAAKDATSDGWQVDLCKQAIIDSAQREMRQSWGIENYDLYQRAIRTGDLYYGIHRSDRIYVASLFIKEFGGKVSHYMVTDQNLGHTSEISDGLNEESGYLFKRRNKFNNFSEVVCPFFFDTGPDGTWHSVKGLGPKIYDFCDISNRTFCQMLDGAVIGSGITLETKDANAIEETQLCLVGGATVVSPGYTVAQTRIAESLQGAMSMRRELHNTMQSNTGSYRQRTEDENKEPTLGQAQMNFQQQTILNKGSTNRYYFNLDKYHRETLRRMLDPAQSDSIPGGREAKMFKARCVLRGIPEQILTQKMIRKVTSTRSLGYGSPQLRDMATKELVALVPFMDEIGRNHALRARASALPGIGMHSVDMFFPPIEKTGVPNAHTALAVLENNALRNIDGKVQVEPQQNHSIHFDVHYGDVQEHLKDPKAHVTEKLTHAENAGPHLTQHLQGIQGDPTRKEEVAKKKQQLGDLAKQTDGLSQQVQEYMKAQMENNGNGQGPSTEDQALIAKTHGELAIKAAKQKADEALKTRSQAFKEALADKKTASDIRRKNLTTKASLQRDSVKTGAEISQSRAKTGAEIAHKTAQTGHEIHRANVQTAADLARAKAESDADIQLKKAQASATIASSEKTASE